MMHNFYSAFLCLKMSHSVFNLPIHRHQRVVGKDAKIPSQTLVLGVLNPSGPQEEVRYRRRLEWMQRINFN